MLGSETDMITYAISDCIINYLSVQ